VSDCALTARHTDHQIADDTLPIRFLVPSGGLRYNGVGLQSRTKRWGESVRVAELFWRLFQITGSINAYLLYRRLTD